MSLFPRFPASEFAPIFRLLDDYDAHRSSKGASQSIRAFTPSFDVKEVKDAYELHGELPGIEQKDVSIEFTDPHTLVIKGRVEREYTSGTPPAALEGGKTKQIEGSHKPTVEDAGEDGEPAGRETSTEIQTSQQGEGQQQQPKAKYWVSERSVGEFHRSFSFPTRVDQDAVKASLKNGILSIIVPKAPAPQTRRIQIE